MRSSPVTGKTPAPTRRHAVVRALGAVLLVLAALPPAVAQQAAPLTFNIVDVAGDLALTQAAFDLYASKHPDRVAKFTYTKATAPEMPAKLKALQAAGRADIDLVLTGVGFLGNGVEQGLFTPLLPEHAARFPDLMSNYLPAAAKMQELARGQGIEVVFMPAGPLIEYNPDKVRTAPTTPAELLAWCKANPNRFIYARPANSGPGNTFIMGLPYILGDSNPKDPINGWDKTWAYLKELDSCIEYYPSGTGATMKEVGEGSRDMTVTMTGWDINPRVLGVIPKNYKVTPFKGMTWVNDAHYMVVPKGVPADRLAVLLDVMNFMLTPEAQAYTWDKGYFYPGPAVKNVPLTLAPKESQDAINAFGRPEYAHWLAEFPHTQSLEPKAQVDAYRIWDERIGGRKLK